MSPARLSRAPAPWSFWPSTCSPLPATPRAPARRLVIELTAAALARLVLSTGRMFGALTGGYVWLWGGLAATGCAAGVLSVLALVSLVWGLRGWHPRPV